MTVSKNPVCANCGKTMWSAGTRKTGLNSVRALYRCRCGKTKMTAMPEAPRAA